MIYLVFDTMFGTMKEFYEDSNVTFTVISQYRIFIVLSILRKS